MLFRPLRFILLLTIAFVVGIFYERQHQAERCAEAGGRIASGLCIGASQ